MKDRFQKLKEKYADHPLFAKCIGARVPGGWLELIDELVIWLDNYNVENKTFIGFAQIKIKFDMLTIYVEHYIDDDYLKHDGVHLSRIREQISSICNKSRLTCKVCGKEKTESVIDSVVRFVCLDHMHNEKTWFAVREKK